MSDERSGKEFNPGDTQVIDLADVDLSALPEPSEPMMGRRTAPPPLPPEASLPPPQPAYGASPSIPPGASFAPPMPEPQRGRSTGFYVALLGAFLVLGIIGGAVVAFMKRPAAGASGAAASASAARGPAVITIPTVDMDDDDAGPAP